ncbi:serine O-acetyltransferase [Arcobacter nitrofigilis DSM 7299]|uniref:serine O-acetyltransferase n=1 Tax=Arcobacter nitrofigilis (strain ATCC 33309 / DSM 7299 / CCUG 15893 / LMG 7604 / NCTC 12251 / CI) TaxID=572480 RepID=D5V011_ARCNC|nr:serine O-acetyltransferase [Arcobacter nitrofigilis]ADG93623.1 serine O-acetyltransferase [Arcobacter nitrofigilis DSM 7299]
MNDEINKETIKPELDTERISLWKQIKEDFSVPKLNDPALNSNIELIFNYPGVWAVINHRIANRLYKKNFKLTSRIIMGLTQFLCNMDIHPAATIGRRVFIDHGIGVVIGETAIVEDDVLIYQGVTLGGVSLNKGKRHPTIKSNSVIGSGAKVLGNITVGKNSKIGANSVVICDVPKNSTAVGVPAKIIKRDDKNGRLNHGDLPDINKEMFEYLLKRVAVLEHAIKKYDGIDLSNEYTDLECIYKKFISAMNSIR